MKIKTSGLGLIALGILPLGAEASSYAVASKAQCWDLLRSIDTAVAQSQRLIQ